jgi:hypothetical protein
MFKQPQQLSEQHAHLWLIQSQSFSLFSPQNHPKIWETMKNLYRDGIHHLPTSLVQDILYIVQREPTSRIPKISMMYDYHATLQKISFMESQSRYLLTTHQYRKEIYSYICLHILTKIASHWPKRFFVYDFSTIEISHIQREPSDQYNQDFLVYSLEDYEEDVQAFLTSLSASKKNVRTFINQNVLSIARHIDILSQRDVQIAWCAFRDATEKGHLLSLQKHNVSFVEEDPDSLFDHDESQKYPRGGYNSISNRGLIHNLLPSQFVYQDICASNSSDTNNSQLDLFSLKYLKNELLFFHRDEGFLFRKKRQLIFVFEEHPLWFYHSDNLDMSMGIAIVALSQIIVSSLLLLQNRESISIDILSCLSEHPKNRSNKGREVFLSKTSGSHQSFQSDIRFLSLFCRENISVKQHGISDMQHSNQESTLYQKLNAIYRKEHDCYVIYFPMHLPLEMTTLQKIKNLTIIPTFLQENHFVPENSSNRPNAQKSKREQDMKSMFEIHDHSSFVDLQSIHDEWIFENLPVERNDPNSFQTFRKII